MDDWSLALSSWVIKDGNYPDFVAGRRVEFAVEFHAPEPLTIKPATARTAIAYRDAWYAIDATVAAVTAGAWFIDCGILVYDDHPPPGVAVGDGVAGRVLLSIDHFLYFETLAKRPDAPAAIYTWDLWRIRRETAPFILNKAGNMWVRDETKRNLVDRDATNAWDDDDGRAEYVFDCRRLDVPPKRTSVTAT